MLRTPKIDPYIPFHSRPRWGDQSNRIALDTSPTTFEQALSHISAGIGALENNAPKTTEDIERVRAQLMRLDRVFAKQEGAMKWPK